MAIDPSMEPMLEMFIYETTTLLDQLDEILLESEKSKSLSSDNINEIFRVMHTIKGSSAMMDLNSISTLAHAVEDVFFIIRENPDRLEPVSEALFDLVFQASDFLKAEVESVQNTGEATQDPGAMIAELEKLAAIMRGEAPAPAAPAAATPDVAATQTAAASEGSATTAEKPGKVRVFFEEGCQMENIRSFMLLTQLHDVCDRLDSQPAHPEKDSSLSAEIIKNGFTVLFWPATAADDVLRVIESSVNIKTYELLEEAAPAPTTVATPGAKPTATTTAKAAAKETAAPAAMPGKAKQNLLSVNQVKLDQLLDLVGELVTTESMVIGSPDLRGLALDNFNKSARELRKLTDELQDVVMSIRMVPLSGVFQRMNRVVRDMCKKLGKEVDLITEGGDTEVDKTINEIIGDPFLHMIRNSMDHAIEPPEERIAMGKLEHGQITISAKNAGGEIMITIADDGRGLDKAGILRKARENGLLTKAEEEYTEKEIYHMIMLPGFSTNKEVTEFSGRGVGMDVVRKNIERVGGTLSIESTPGEGTTFIISIPLTLAILNGMALSVGDSTFTLPITSIRQSFKLGSEQKLIYNTDGSEMILMRGECYPLIRLHEVFHLDTPVTELSEGILIQIESGERIACVFADELVGERQIVVKPFPPFLGKYEIKKSGLSGCSILGDGSISLILDANSLMKANL
ncbi:MAG: two-component system, chemotaxis family, sensor kinase CheA [Clostridiales bacterium]|jgi:two-component system chemotaxis sensor kinase CheA|nr:two-component system, chemotaxis family, sensor kinase CheA [Clostridiales bacterium]